MVGRWSVRRSSEAPGISWRCGLTPPQTRRKASCTSIAAKMLGRPQTKPAVMTVQFNTSDEEDGRSDGASSSSDRSPTHGRCPASHTNGKHVSIAHTESGGSELESRHSGVDVLGQMAHLLAPSSSNGPESPVSRAQLLIGSKDEPGGGSEGSGAGALRFKVCPWVVVLCTVYAWACCVGVKLRLHGHVAA